MRLLAGAALLACIGILLLARWISIQPQWAATWQARPDGQLELVGTTISALKPHTGQTWIGTTVGSSATSTSRSGSVPSALDRSASLQPHAVLLRGSARWIADDGQRARHVQLNESLAAALAAGPVTLHFEDQSQVEVQATAPGWRGIPLAYWLLASLALALWLAGAGVVLVKPSTSNALYAVMTWCQAGRLMCMAVASTASPMLPAGWAGIDFPLRSGFDMLTVAAAVHLACIHPKPLQAARWLPITGWLFAGVIWVLARAGNEAGAWWLMQLSMLLMWALAIWLMHLSFRSHPHPFALLMKRFSVVVGGTWVLVSAAVAWSSMSGSAEAVQLTARLPLAVTAWQVLFALVLLSAPFLSKSRSLMRELSLLAVITALASVLDLLIVGLFQLNPFASLTLTLFISLVIYAGARQWLVDRMLGTRVASTERLFEQLFRTTREVEAQPSQAGPALARLLDELFDPAEISLLDKPVTKAHPLSDGSAMLVPVPAIGSIPNPGAATSILLRRAQQGRRLFTTDDARLADRIGEQLRRTVAFDQAVEQGRSEERRRLAQDLHDDIGARLLTLMYKAESSELEDYARHTLQDLKTLTRGLAASNQPLSHALAEWKADIAQRLSAAGIELTWTARYDTDIVLTMVQWSALTRVLRELVSNVMAHAAATRVDIQVCLAADRLQLTVMDDGTGQTPQQWSPGLGVGGVRKRVRQLGGEVTWQQRTPRGIACQVTIERLSAPAMAD